MNPSGPSPISPGIAGAPLTNTAIDSKKNQGQPTVRRDDESVIRDTVETSDREADGKMPHQHDAANRETGPGSDPSSQIDLCG